MKTILIPTDFSDNAGDALAYALDLIGNSRANIHIINVVDPNYPPADMSGGNTDLMAVKMQNARKSMEALEAFSAQYYGDDIDAKIHITGDVAVGSIASSIKDAAKTIHADLIIIGTQGVNHNPIQRILGTVSTAVLRDASCPVILIPKGYTFKPLDEVLFSTNLNHADPFELWRAAKVLKPHLGIVRCLHVVKNETDKNDERIEEFAKYMIEHSPAIQTIFNVEVSDDVEETIAEYAANYDVGLIIMHKVKQAFWDRIIAVSHTKRMASMIKTPLMVVND